MDGRRTGRMSHLSERRILVWHCADASTLDWAPCIALLGSPHLSLIRALLSAVLAVDACGRSLATGVTGWQPQTSAHASEAASVLARLLTHSPFHLFSFLRCAVNTRHHWNARFTKLASAFHRPATAPPVRRASPVSIQQTRAVKATLVCDVSSVPLATMSCCSAATTAARRRIRHR